MGHKSSYHKKGIFEVYIFFLQCFPLAFPFSYPLPPTNLQHYWRKKWDSLQVQKSMRIVETERQSRRVRPRFCKRELSNLLTAVKASCIYQGGSGFTKEFSTYFCNIRHSNQDFATVESRARIFVPYFYLKIFLGGRNQGSFGKKESVFNGVESRKALKKKASKV